MGNRTNWNYNHAINRVSKEGSDDARYYLVAALLIGIPLVLVINRGVLGMILGIVLLPLPIIYYFVFFKRHFANKRSIQGFNSSAAVTVGNGMLAITDGRANVKLYLENVRELAVFITAKRSKPSHWWIIATKGFEYILPENTEGLESLLREFRDDPVFDTHPLDRPDVKTGKWTIWQKEGAG
jgi:hypothetical protein